MNIFLLSRNPTKCAQMYCDQHVIKILLEIVQMLYTAWHVSGIPDDWKPPLTKSGARGYKKTHANHPMCKWVRSSEKAYSFTCKLGMALAIEYNFRFDKCHACTKHVLWLSSRFPVFESQTKFPQCMPDEHKQKNTILAYQSYYKTKTFGKWTKRNMVPYNDMTLLLSQSTVIRWLRGDLGFLPAITSKNKTVHIKELKKLEDQWGREIMKLKNPGFKANQWTGQLGEEICKELFNLMGKSIKKPDKKNHYRPDFETDDYIIEVKSETYFTTGTAGEKILGVPFKYAEIPELYQKPLRILCLGGAEKACREEYGILPGTKCTPSKQKFIDFFSENNIQYVSFTDFAQGLHLPEIQDSLNLLSDDTISPPSDTL